MQHVQFVESNVPVSDTPRTRTPSGQCPDFFALFSIGHSFDRLGHSKNKLQARVQHEFSKCPIFLLYLQLDTLPTSQDIPRTYSEHFLDTLGQKLNYKNILSGLKLQKSQVLRAVKSNCRNVEYFGPVNCKNALQVCYHRNKLVSLNRFFFEYFCRSLIEIYRYDVYIYVYMFIISCTPTMSCPLFF